MGWTTSNVHTVRYRTNKRVEMSKEMFDELQKMYDKMSIAELGATIRDLKIKLDAQ